MSTPIDDFRVKFRTSELRILEMNHWTWAVRPVHSTLGAGILSLNRDCGSLGSISREEAAELAPMTKEIEQRLIRSFNPSKFNYVMLMMVDLHLHFHVIPRYERLIDFGGIQWKDNGWPALPQLGDGTDLQEDPILLLIRDELRRSL